MRMAALLLFVSVFNVMAGDVDQKNPFGVDTAAKPVTKEKTLDPALTADERDVIAKFARAGKDGAQGVEITTQYQTVITGVVKRFRSGVPAWTDEDVKARIKLCSDIVTADKNALNNSGFYIGVNDAVETYVGLHDTDANSLVKRIELVASGMDSHTHQFTMAYSLNWRKAVALFMSQDKFKDSTPKQKLELVENFVLPKVPVEVRKRLVEYVKDLREDAGVPEPKVESKRTK